MASFGSRITLFGLLCGIQHQMVMQLSNLRSFHFMLEVGYGNLAFYMAPTSKGWFSYKRATDELEIDDGRMSFFGHCIAVL
jgi:hypothetical protein